ncbi:unnamed protein product, partial [Vitis vinifera]
MDLGDWRTQLSPDSRQGAVNRIMDTLKRHLPVSGQEGLRELRKIAVRFEEKIYTAATSQSDYLQKISLKILTMETKNSAGNSQNPPDPDWLPKQGASLLGVYVGAFLPLEISDDILWDCFVYLSS